MIWESLDTNKLPTDFCYTADGLLLGATQGGRLVVQAASVSRAAQADALFDPPRNTIDLASSRQNNHEERDAAEMPLHELFHPNPTEVSERDRGKFAVEGWHRLTAPLTVLSFAMIGLVAVLRGAFSRHGNITRPMTAILTVVGLQALTLMLQNLAGRNLALVPLIWAVAILPSLICAALLFAEQWTGTSQQAKQSS